MITDIHSESGTAVAAKNDFTEPPEYRVILLNDDYTTKDFVAQVLIRVFRKTEADAVMLTEKIHVSGSAVVGIYIYDIAATRPALTIQTARQNGFPLPCIMKKV